MGSLCGSRALVPLPSPPTAAQKTRIVRAAGSGAAEPSLRRARFRPAPFPRDAAAPRAPAPAPPAPASPAPPARSSRKPRSRRRRLSRGEDRAARDRCPVLRTREAAARAAAPDAAAAAAATPPSVLLPGGHGPTAPQGSPFPQDGRPFLHSFLSRRAPTPAAGTPPAHRRQRGSLHVYGAVGGGAPGSAPARGTAGRAGPSQGLQLPGVRPCLCQPSAAAEPPRVALGPQALHVRRLRQGLQALQPPVAAPCHAPCPCRPAAHLPALPTPLPGRRGAGAARAPPLSSRPGRCYPAPLWATKADPHSVTPPPHPHTLPCSAEVSALHWASVSPTI